MTRPALAAFLLGMAALSTSGERAAESVRGLVISARGFEPAVLTVRRGELLRLDVESGDDAQHCFALDEARVERRVSPGRKTRIDVVPERNGRFPYYCCLHGNAASDRERGTLVVSE